MVNDGHDPSIGSTKGVNQMQWIPDMIRRLQALRGPNQDINVELWKYESKRGMGVIAPNYTGNINDALTLVHKLPGSMRLATTFTVGGFVDGRPHGGWAKVYQCLGMAGGPPDADPPEEAKDCATPAIALCIAALKARRDMR